MKLAALTIIAELPATDPAIGQNGKVIGFPAANAIGAALDAAGYVVVHRDDLAKLEAGMKFVLDALETKKRPRHPDG